MVGRVWQQVFLWPEEHMVTVGSLLSRPCKRTDQKDHGTTSLMAFSLVTYFFQLRSTLQKFHIFSKQHHLLGTKYPNTWVSGALFSIQTTSLGGFHFVSGMRYWISFALSYLKILLQNFLSKVVFVTDSSIWFLFCCSKIKWTVGLLGQMTQVVEQPAPVDYLSPVLVPIQS